MVCYKDVEPTFWPGLRGFREHDLENDKLPGKDNEVNMDLARNKSYKRCIRCSSQL